VLAIQVRLEDEQVEVRCVVPFDGFGSRWQQVGKSIGEIRDREGIRWVVREGW
jgi:hypothetical protein